MIESALQKIRWSGYTIPLHSFEALRERFLFYLAVEKDRREIPFFWIAVIGGTGTGKSTIFNSLVGANISVTGIERPKTRGPIAAFPRGKGQIKLTCFTTVDVSHSTSEPLEGIPGVLTVTEHSGSLPWVFIDSPDIDSLVKDHHRIAEKIFFLSDFVLFVVSQEKYADERLNRFFHRIIQEGKSFLLVVNKATEELRPDDILQVLRLQGFQLDYDTLIILPFTRPVKGQLNHTEAWKELQRRLNNMVGNNRWKAIRIREDEKSHHRMLDICKEIASTLRKEREALMNLIGEIQHLAERSVYEVLERHIETVREHTKTHLQPQIKALYSRYDIFGKPRRAIGQAISKIFEFLGVKISEEETDSQESILRRIEKQIDHSPVFYAIDFLVTEVLKRVPPEKIPLAEIMRTPEVILSKEDIQNLMLKNSQELFGWLDKKFQALMEGIPKTKELGIYSSFALWGIFILGIEAAIGGGLSIVKAAIDAIIAPFITKATVELFASHEIYGIVEELSSRYKKGLQSIILLQRDRFISSVKPFIPDEDLIKSLEDFKLF